MSARYTLPQHPAFSDPLSKEDLYTLVARGSLARGEMCLDEDTGHMHTVGELVSRLGWIWPFEVVSLLLPTGMFSVFSGSIDDGWGGMLGWFWAACAVGTIALVVVTKAALKERAYAAVMAATGLLYLAIHTAFGTDLVARDVPSA